MKKSLIALAVLATTGAAFAQSSVALYGRLDVGVANVKNEVSGDGVSRTKLDSNILNNSLWGLRGVEDLGNGLKATFNIESGLSVDTGAQADTTRLFNRKATVGLAGAFGTVELGRNYTAYDTLRADTNNTADTNVAVTNNVWAVGGDYANRVDNAIRFDSANYGGFSGSVAYAFGENKDLNGTTYTPGRDSTDNLSLHVKYANGPLLVGYAHQNEKQAVVGSTKYNLVAGSYDFGVAKLNAGFNKVSRAGNSDDTEYQVGVSAPFGATTVYFGYAHAKNEVGAAETKRSGFDLAATYALSKRTVAYAGYQNFEVKSTNKETTVVGAGIRHVF